MISFIVIGLNEGQKLTNCLNSISKVISESSLNDSEIIYVDSSSSDDSIARAEEFGEVRIIRITGHCNAAVARNAGARESKGDALFFIDGDMELLPGFLQLVCDDSSQLKYDFVTGYVADRNYNQPGKVKNDDGKPEGSAKRSRYKTGGLFLIRRRLWERAGGMNTAMRINEDIDFGIRMAKLGVKPVRRPEPAALHHTIPYSDRSRIWRHLFSGAENYRAVVLRNNLSNVTAWKFFFRTNYTFFLLLVAFIFTLWFMAPAFLLFYPVAVISRVMLRKGHNISEILQRFVYIIIYEMLMPFMFLFFHPSVKKVEYKIVREQLTTQIQ